MEETWIVSLLSLQPSQLYVSEYKLEKLNAQGFRETAMGTPTVKFPVRRLGGNLVLLDGHTRALVLYLNGVNEVTVYVEPEEYCWATYLECVRWCKAENILTIANLKERVVDHAFFTEHWIERCQAFSAQLSQ